MSEKPKPTEEKSKLNEEVKKAAEEHKLKHTETIEKTGLDNAKFLGEVKKAHDLEHQEKPKDGLTEAQKQAFLEEQKEKEKTKKQ